MKLTGLHFLLTYQCTYECDHCFVWGSPRQKGTMNLENIRTILHQAKEVGSIKSVYFEGGEPFLYYPVLLRGVREASEMGFQVGIVSNGYWATTKSAAMEWLIPFDGLLHSLSISCDNYHKETKFNHRVKNAQTAAKKLNISCGVISIAQPEEVNQELFGGKLPRGESAVMYRGRAVEKLVSKAILFPWGKFTECLHEDLREPGRVHVDPFGNLHICQGISIGNLFQRPLKEICESYNPDSHPIVGPLLKGGPAELARHYNLPHNEQYADGCHLCYETRKSLRAQFSEILTPDAMYGVM